MRLLTCLLFLSWPFFAYAAIFSIEERVAQFTPAFEARLRPLFRKAGLGVDPVRAVLVFYKDRRRLDVYAGRRGGMKYLKTYPVTAASGVAGPKLRKGDHQVPEGVYNVSALNPNSLFHLSLRLDYPNARDRAAGRSEGRSDLGGDIMIHGNEVSDGCVAIGDDAIEELFVFAAKTDLSQWKVIITPTDFREKSPRRDQAIQMAGQGWIRELYADIESELRALPK